MQLQILQNVFKYLKIQNGFVPMFVPENILTSVINKKLKNRAITLT